MRDIRSALDDLLPVLREGHALTLRSTIAPGTTDFVAGYLAKRRGFAVGTDLYVAHAPERIAAGRFLEEIGTLPCIVGGVGEASGDAVGRLFEVFGAPIVQTTPVQAELAKIWTNILRYTHFALPNLLMMDCEQLRRERVRGHRPDQPRLPARRDRPAGAHGRHVPAQGLRVLRGALQLAGHAARGLARERVGPALPGRGRQAAARLAAGPEGRGARARVQGRHGRRARLAVAQARADARARARRRRRPRSPRAHADGHVRRCRHRGRRRLRRDQPLASSAAPDGLRAIAERVRGDTLLVDPWNCWGVAQVFAYANEVAALASFG